MAPDPELRRHLDRRFLESAVSGVHLSEGAFSVGLTFNSPVAADEFALPDASEAWTGMRVGVRPDLCTAPLRAEIRLQVEGRLHRTRAQVVDHR